MHKSTSRRRAAPTRKICALWSSIGDDDIKTTLDTRRDSTKWSTEQANVFHLIREVYGQMVSSKRRYGIMHVHERWWFCCRTAEGDFKISQEVTRETDGSNPSVLQCILALCLQSDFATIDDDSLPTKRPGVVDLDNNATSLGKKDPVEAGEGNVQTSKQMVLWIRLQMSVIYKRFHLMTKKRPHWTILLLHTCLSQIAYSCTPRTMSRLLHLVTILRSSSKFLGHNDTLQKN